MVESTQNLSVNEVKAKFQTKRGFWLFMNYSVGAYTPDYKSVSMFYLGQLWRGEKKFIKSSQIIPIEVPLYPGLFREDFLAQVNASEELKLWFPDVDDQPRLKREFICNVLNTFDQAGFSAYCEQQIRKRQEKVMINNDLNVATCPAIAEALNETNLVETNKGRSHHMIKASFKRRRSKKQIEADRQREEELEAEQAFIKSTIVDQKKLIEDLQSQIAELSEQSQMASQLHQAEHDSMQIDSKKRYAD